MSFFKAFLITLLLASTLYSSDSFSVIVAKDSQIEFISKKALSKIFLAKTKSLPNGEMSVVLELDNKNYQSKFYKAISGKSMKQLKRYWATLIFSGRGSPPKKMKSEAEIIEYVKNNSNAIAYIPSTQVLDESVKVVSRIKHAY